MPQALVDRFSRSFDENAAVGLLRRAIGTASVTGAEARLAQALGDELRAIDAHDVVVQEFLAGRPNVTGVRRGDGGLAPVLLIGHTDTVHVRGWKEHWKGDTREDPFGAAIVDGSIWGRGAADLKAGICMTIEAVRLLDRAGVSLARDVQFAFIGDEESGEPGRGVSAGMRSFCEKLDDGSITHPSFAIYVEPTRLDVYTAQIGFFIAEVAVEGRTAYFGVPEQGVDALKAGHAILTSLWHHDAAIRAVGTHDLVGPAFLLVTGIEAGGFVAVPGNCRFSLICKLRPGETLDRAKEDLEAVIHSTAVPAGNKVAIDYPAGRDHPIGGLPFETDSALPDVRRLIACIRDVVPARGRIQGAPFWSEGSFLTTRGIPTVYFAPGDIRICHTFDERVPIDEYRQGIIALALFLAGEGGD